MLRLRVLLPVRVSIEPRKRVNLGPNLTPDTTNASSVLPFCREPTVHESKKPLRAQQSSSRSCSTTEMSVFHW